MYFKYSLIVLWLVTASMAFNQYHFKRHYTSRYDSSEEDNSVLRTYRRCMWEQSKSLPRRLVLLSLCSNLFCENNHIVPRSRSIFVIERLSRPNDCLDILPEECEQGDEEELMYKPFPDCCPVYCNLKRRLRRLRTMHLRHRMLLNKHRQEADTGTTGVLLSEYGLNNMNFK